MGPWVDNLMEQYNIEESLRPDLESLHERVTNHEWRVIVTLIVTAYDYGWLGGETYMWNKGHRMWNKGHRLEED